MVRKNCSKCFIFVSPEPSHANKDEGGHISEHTKEKGKRKRNKQRRRKKRKKRKNKEEEEQQNVSNNKDNNNNKCNNNNNMFTLVVLALFDLDLTQQKLLQVLPL